MRKKLLPNYAEPHARDRAAFAIAQRDGCGFAEAWLRARKKANAQTANQPKTGGRLRVRLLGRETHTR